ncbi:MAG: DUF559 domain-containing protein [Chloroflexota bacterium]|nr:DUF559 domain-containing protein [Chloroflexota bacterium]
MCGEGYFNFTKKLDKVFQMGNSKTWIPTHTDRNYYDDIKARARNMRKQPTLAERVLWKKLRNKQVKGYRFRRQHTIDRFIVDFYCRQARLVIEVDGAVHGTTEAIEYDHGRQVFLENRGLNVLRFSNAQVINDLDAVLQCIEDYLSRYQAENAGATSD